MFIRQFAGSCGSYTFPVGIELWRTDFSLGFCSCHCTSRAVWFACRCTGLCRNQACKGTIDATKAFQETISRCNPPAQRVFWHNFLCRDLLHADLFPDCTRRLCYVVRYPSDSYADAYLRLLGY